MPREDVIDVPAVGDGLCVSNVLQSNMVLQRDKPIHLALPISRGDRNQIIQALRQQDTPRRLQEARQIIEAGDGKQSSG